MCVRVCNLPYLGDHGRSDSKGQACRLSHNTLHPALTFEVPLRDEQRADLPLAQGVHA